MRRRLQWVIHLRAHGLRKGDGHPAYIPDGLRHTLPYLTVRARDGGGQMSAMLSDEGGNVRGGGKCAAFGGRKSIRSDGINGDRMLYVG